MASTSARAPEPGVPASTAARALSGVNTAIGAQELPATDSAISTPSTDQTTVATTLTRGFVLHAQPTSTTSPDRAWAAQPSIELYAPIEELPREFARTLRLSLETGGRSAVIHLSPPELGNVKIQISLTGDRVIAHAEVERDDVRAMLEQSRPALDQQLHRAGLVLDRLVIENCTHGKPLDSWNGNTNGQSPSHANWNGSNHGNSRHHAATPENTHRPSAWNVPGSRATAPISMTGPGSTSMAGTSRRLDLRV